MPRRTAATLVEVLVAIFVMGIGLLAILALFPIGAYRMAQAIQDGRMANISQSAMAVINIPYTDQNGNFGTMPHDSALVVPYYTNPFSLPPNSLPAANSLGPSYPVLLDPIGYRSASGTGFQSMVAGIPGLTRTGVGPPNSFTAVNPPNPPFWTVNFFGGPWTDQNSDGLAMRWFGFQDDILFNTSGGANKVGVNLFERDVRYSWAYLFQLPRTGDPSVAHVSILAFNRRPLTTSGGLSLPETAYSASFDTSRNIVQVTYKPLALPPLRVGEWIIDTSLVQPPFALFPSAHAYAYRVVSINDLGGVVEYEVETPLRGFPGVGTFSGSAGFSPRVIVLEGLAEVFEKGPVRVP